MTLKMVSLDLEAIKTDGYVMPECFIRICNVEANSDTEALSKFRERTGFRLNGKYVKICEV